MSSVLSYPTKQKLYDHQMKTWVDSRDKVDWGLFLEQGLGKSAIAILTAAWLFDQGKIDTFVIIAPKGVYLNWVREELPKHLPDHVVQGCFTAVWSSYMVKADLAKVERALAARPGLTIIAMNIETLQGTKAPAYLEKVLKAKRCLVVVDESTQIKSKDAKKTKELLKLRHLMAYRRILTGTPVTRSPLDLYAQCGFLDLRLLGFSSFYAFKARYAIEEDAFYGTRRFKTITGYRRVEELTERLKEFSTRLLKEDCLDLPAKIYETRDVELTKQQAEVYDQVRHEAVAELSSGVVSIVEALTKLTRLHQVVCGHIPIDGGGIEAVPSNRFDELLQVLEEADGKAIIWANYRYSLDEVYRGLSDRFDPRAVVRYYGGVSDDERARAVRDFQDPDSDVRYFVGNPQTSGYGLTLTRARTVIYYSNSYNLEHRLQSEDRAHRIGQTRSVTYVDLVARGTVDEKILKALLGKYDLASQTLGDIRTWFNP